jgi:hypothetical protein
MKPYRGPPRARRSVVGAVKTYRPTNLSVVVVLRRSLCQRKVSLRRNFTVHRVVDESRVLCPSSPPTPALGLSGGSISA